MCSEERDVLRRTDCYYGRTYKVNLHRSLGAHIIINLRMGAPTKSCVFACSAAVVVVYALSKLIHA